MKKRLLIVLIALAASASCQTLRGPLPLPSPTPTSLPQPIGKPLVVPAVPGLYLAWDSSANAMPPTREPGDPLAPGNEILGVECGAYLGSGGDIGATGVWDSRDAIDWSPYDTCINKASATKVRLTDGRAIAQPVILTIPGAFSDTGAQWHNTTGHGAPGSAGNPFVRLHLPPWMQNDAYRFTFAAPSGKIYQSIRYAGEFKQRMIEFIQAAGQRYNVNPQVAAVRVRVGAQGESQPVVQCQSYWNVAPSSGRDTVNCGGDSLKTVMAEHEKTVSCIGYMNFVRDLSQAAFAAFPDKAVLSMVDADPCSTMGGKAFRKWLYEEQWPGKPIGVSMNNISIDLPDADERPTNLLAPWSKWTIGRTMRGLGYPMLYEFDAHTPSVEGMYWTVLSAAGNGANFILYPSSWNGSFSQAVWQVADYWLASERRAWLVFRDREYPTYDFTAGYGTSGSMGDWGKYLRAVNADDAPQACAPVLAKSAASANATAAAGGALNLTPACPQPLPTPAITPAAQPSPGPDLLNRLFDRQARLLDPGTTLRITVSGNWPAYGASTPAVITVSYLDIGIDAFDVVLPGANGRPARRTIQKTGAGVWQQAIWTDNLAIGNLLDGNTFVQIINDVAGPEYLHEVHITVPEGSLSARASPASMLTSRPAAAATPQLTATATTAADSLTASVAIAVSGPTSTAAQAAAALGSPSATPVPAATLAQIPSAASGAGATVLPAVTRESPALILAAWMLPPATTPAPAPASTPGSIHTSSPTASSSAPTTVRAKVEIVWPHDGARVQDADLANITAYLLAGDGKQGTRNLLDSVPCDWEPTVWLWRALNNQPAKIVGVGKKRMVTGGGRSFPAWDFNDVDVSQARDPANKLSFFVTVDGPDGPVRTLHNVWAHASDARTIFPQQDVPTSVTRLRPSAVDSRIQIVWPQGNLPVQQAQRANITTYLFHAGTQQAFSPDTMTVGGWSPKVRLHMSLNNEPEEALDRGIVGVPRVVTGANGLKFLAWDFNDVDVSLADDPLNRLYFWVTVDGITTYSNIWAHGADARTLFPQPDVLNPCK